VGRIGRQSLRLAPIAVLAAENLLVFWRHYFGGYGFPWDFLGSYYAAAAYWTEAVSRGPLPMWMPFQSMGYPFLLNLQTGLFYPPMWVFPLLSIPYTLPAAVVFQCLHVFAGALGMYALVRGLLRSRREALLAAFCFQLFGGFYSNAQHVDIVRSFALTPWLLWACVPPRPSEGDTPRRLLLAPLFVFAMAVGGYPGNLIAALFLVPVFAALVVVQRRFARPAWRWAGALAASTMVGLAMAAIHLGPAWMYRDELLRYHNAERILRASLGIAHLPGLLLENRGMPLDKSMSSTFVGVAVLAGVCFLTWTSLKRLWPYVALTVLSAGMAAGNTLPLAPLLRRLFPPLGFSRFPSSDYRGVFAILLILLAAAGWRDLRHRRLGATGFLLRLLPVTLFAGWSIARLYGERPYWPDRGQVELGVVATFAALAAWRMRPAVWTGLLAMLAAVSLNASRVLPRIEGWVEADVIEICRLFAPTPARMYDTGIVVAPDLLATREGSRPPRDLGDGPYRASGYLRGDFLIADFGAAAGLQARDTLMRDQRYLAFMCREWTPVLVDLQDTTGGSVQVLSLPAKTLRATRDPRIVPESFDLDGARYLVETDQPLLLVENEIYFPGWSSDRAGDAVRVNGSLRGWRLPAGTYTLETRFRLPGLRLFAAVSAAAWILWVAWAVVLTRQRLAR
jgi:hypothetical protein